MGLFNFKKNNGELSPFTIYIADDNTVYLKQLEFYLKKMHGEKIQVDSFPVSEVIAVKLENGHIPDVIIMDHHLSGKYEDASTGIDALNEIHEKHPKIALILHSANHSLLTENEKLYVSIPKNEDAFEEISQFIEQKMLKNNK